MAFDREEGECLVAAEGGRGGRTPEERERGPERGD